MWIFCVADWSREVTLGVILLAFAGAVWKVLTWVGNRFLGKDGVVEKHMSEMSQIAASSREVATATTAMVSSNASVAESTQQTAAIVTENQGLLVRNGEYMLRLMEEFGNRDSHLSTKRTNAALVLLALMIHAIKDQDEVALAEHTKKLHEALDPNKPL